MFRRSLILALLSFSLLAQAQNRATKQTPRQALLEILFGEEATATLRHLPSATLTELSAAPEVALRWRAEIQDPYPIWLPGVPTETFDSGPMLAVTESETSGRTELSVDREEVVGDEAEFEIGLHELPNGQEDTDLFSYGIVFKMKEEAGVWKLVQVESRSRIRLDDPKIAKEAVREAIASRPVGNEASAIGGVRTIVTAQVIYAATWPEAGFTCDLASLGPGDAKPNEHQAGLIDSILASGRSRGYLYELSGCSGAPSETFRITAIPDGSSAKDRRAFCSDQSGVVRFSEEGSAEGCLARGEPLE